MLLWYVTLLLLLFRTVSLMPCNWSGWGTCDSTRTFLNATDEVINEFEAIVSNVYLTNADLWRNLDEWSSRQTESIREAYQRRRQQVLLNTDQANQLRLQLAENSTEEVAHIMQKLIQISMDQSIARAEQSAQISEIMNTEPDAVVLEILNIEQQIVNVGLKKTYFQGSDSWVPENTALESDINFEETSSGMNVDVTESGSEVTSLTHDEKYLDIAVEQ